jgi:hypothetical protein
MEALLYQLATLLIGTIAAFAILSSKGDDR